MEVILDELELLHAEDISKLVVALFLKKSILILFLLLVINLIQVTISFVYLNLKSPQKLIKNISSFFFFKFFLLTTLSIGTSVLLLNLFFFIIQLNAADIELLAEVEFNFSRVIIKVPLVIFDYYIFIDFVGLLFCILAFFVGILSLLALDSRFYWSNMKFIINCNVLSSALFLFTTTDNLLLLFFYYECLLIPSFLFVYFVSPYKRTVQAALYFLVWTQLGSLLVLLGVSYIFYTTGEFSLNSLQDTHFSKNECYVLYLIFFIGFGIKIPIWPFHHWLTKTHVEAPAGFSMFLSGFLVKSALYGFFKLTTLFDVEFSNIFTTALLFIGVADSSLKMWAQTDLKKLIAFSTVQEMNLIYLAFSWGGSYALSGGLFFCVTHSFLSPLLFYTVDCVQRRTGTRTIAETSGILSVNPHVGIVIFSNLVFYSGLPGTLKFISEMYLYSGFLENGGVALFITLTAANLLGYVGLCKCWFDVLFGMTVKNKTLMADLTTKEILIICSCYSVLILSSSCVELFFQ